MSSKVFKTILNNARRVLALTKRELKTPRLHPDFVELQRSNLTGTLEFMARVKSNGDVPTELTEEWHDVEHRLSEAQRQFEDRVKTGDPAGR